MNQARDKSTESVVDAEELKNISSEELSEYECIDENCKIELIPCSYKRTNKIRPYFKSFKNVDHTDKCQFSRFLKILDQAKKRRLEASEFENLPYPSKLIKPVKKIEETTLKQNENDVDLEEITGTKRKSTNLFEESANANRSVTTISQIVDFYLNCPYNRDVELNILDKNESYKYWFRRIKDDKSYDGTRIYFGKLHANFGYVDNKNGSIKIKLFECQTWQESTGAGLLYNKKEQKNPYMVNVNLENLSSHKSSRLMSEIEYAINEKKANFNNKKKNAYVFFLGTPTANKEFSFDVIDGYLVTRFTEIKFIKK